MRPLGFSKRIQLACLLRMHYLSGHVAPSKELIMKKKGFTLVELMVVIVIIGILAALAIPRFLGASAKAKASEFKPVLKQLVTLEEAYRQERDTYTTSTADLAFDAPSGGAARFTYAVVGADASSFTVAAYLSTTISNVVPGSTAYIQQDGVTKGGTGTLTSLANWK